MIRTSIFYLIIQLSLSALTSQAMGMCPVQVQIFNLSSPHGKNTIYSHVKDILEEKSYTSFLVSSEREHMDISGSRFFLNIDSFSSVSITITLGYFSQDNTITFIRQTKRKENNDENYLDVLKSAAEQIPVCEEANRMKTQATINYDKWNTIKNTVEESGLNLECGLHIGNYFMIRHALRGAGDLVSLKSCVQFIELTDFVSWFSSNWKDQLPYWNNKRNVLVLSNEFFTFHDNDHARERYIFIDIYGVLKAEKTLDYVMEYLKYKQ